MMRYIHSAMHFAREATDVPNVVRNLVRHAELIRTMFWRDFTARYRASFGGLVWSVVQPLVMMAVYTLVFSTFLQVRFATDADPWSFPVYLLCGMLAWTSFSESMAVSTNVIRANINFVKRVVFPLEILPLNVTLVSTVQQIVGFILLIPLAWVVSGQLQWTLLAVPFIFILQIMFTVGLCWIVASLAVYLPDLGQVISLILTAWLFLTPVFYPQDIVPAWGQFIFTINPVAHLINFYRGAVITGELPSLLHIAGVGLLCLVVFLLGYFWFMHTKKGFADVL